MRARDGAEDNGFTRFIGDGERQLCFEDGAGVVIETAHNAQIDSNPIRTVTSVHKNPADRIKIIVPFDDGKIVCVVRE